MSLIILQRFLRSPAPSALPLAVLPALPLLPSLRLLLLLPVVLLPPHQPQLSSHLAPLVSAMALLVLSLPVPPSSLCNHVD